MEYVKLGRTGLEVSRLCLGCMTFGEPTRGRHPWSLDEEHSVPLIRQALDAGVNFLDTANVYSDGSSEEIVGRAIRGHARRDELVLATKVFSRMGDGPNRHGLSRKAILQEIDHSLRRLGVDYVDLYQIHRWDDSTPIEETLAALHDVVKAGKARYVGASSMHAWQFAKALYTARIHGWTEFVSMQDHYNLIQREEERDMLPLCADQGTAVLPWSPLARGRLARPWGADSARQQADDYGKTLYRGMEESDRGVVDAVGKIAAARGISRAQVALAWLLQRQPVTAPIVGARTPQQLADAIGAVALRLSADEVQQLEAPYRPHPVVGFT